MIHFSAFANNSRQDPLPDRFIKKWANCNLFPKLTNRWTYAQNNVFMSIQGDCSISQFVHTSPRTVLVCHADLLGIGDCSDYREASQNPAKYIARLYEERGDEFTRDLHGWFGIVIYDLKQDVLKAWTDHFGARRIIYRAIAGATGIASDLRILNSFFSRAPEINPQAILEYLKFSCIPAPRTIYKDTFRLEPGHRLTSRPSVTSRVYWDMTYDEEEGRDLKTWASRTFDAIESAVAKTVKTKNDSQHVGCFLSGGTDSSSVSGLVGRITGKPPSTFSIGFDDPRYNEIEYARIAAKAFKADHHEYFVTPHDILDLIPLAVQTYDEPFGNSSIIPAYYCAKLAATTGVTHLLAGDGGDELFGGNQRYISDRVFQKYHALPASLRRCFLEPCVKHVSQWIQIPTLAKAARYVRRANIQLPDRYFSYDLLSSIPAAELLSPDFLASLSNFDPMETARRHFRSVQTNNDLNRWLYLDLKITINDNDIRKVTPMVELAGITARYPLLDMSLAEFSGKIPAGLKVRKNELRYLFKIAMAGLLPADIIKKTKHGFGLPYSMWLGENAQIKQFTFDTLGSAQSRQRGYLRPDLLEWLWAGYKEVHSTFYGDVMWVFLMLEAWHQQQPDAVQSCGVAD